MRKLMNLEVATAPKSNHSVQTCYRPESRCDSFPSTWRPSQTGNYLEVTSAEISQNGDHLSWTTITSGIRAEKECKRDKK